MLVAATLVIENVPERLKDVAVMFVAVSAPVVVVPSVVLPKLFELPDAVMLPLVVTVVADRLVIVVLPKLLLLPEAITLALLVIAPEEIVPMLTRLRLESKIVVPFH